jgi:hypothetical protein
MIFSGHAVFGLGEESPSGAEPLTAVQQILQP